MKTGTYPAGKNLLRRGADLLPLSGMDDPENISEVSSPVRDVSTYQALGFA